MHCLWEIIDNSVDEALGGHGSHILVALHDDGSVEVHDEGRGVPVDIEKKTGLTGVEVVFTKLHAGGKFGGGSYVATGGLHGVGASVVNALSSRLDVEVDKGGATWAMSFRRGEPGVFAGDGPDADFTPGNELRKIGKVAKAAHRHAGPLLGRPPDLHQGREVRLRRADRPRPADVVPGAGSRAGHPRRARRRAARGEVPPRRRHRGVLRVPGPRRAGLRRAAAAGRGRVHRDRPAAGRQGAHDAAGHRAHPRCRHRVALGHGLRHRAQVVRQHHRHAQGRHPRQRLRARASPRRSTTS